MQTTTINIVGKNNVIVPITAPVGLDMPQHIDDYDSCCGSGKGLGDVIVPETMWGLTISPACFVHDAMWAQSRPTWDDFNQGNTVFLLNLVNLVQLQSKSTILKWARLYRCVTYYNAVDSVGCVYFWNSLGVYDIPERPLYRSTYVEM